VVNPLRIRLGLAPFANPLVDGNSPQLVLFAASRHVRLAPPDWPPHYQLTGYFFLDDAEGWVPPADLVGFLDAGERPVVLTFGSMPASTPSSGGPRALAALLLEACERAGARALLQGGAGYPAADVPTSAWLVGAMPHAWLFARAACVVHHGGAGTMAAAFRAGVPQVVVPHAHDQFVWADLAHQLGCAAAPLRRAQLTAERLARTLRSVLDTPAIRERAAALGDKIRAEQGVARARQLIEDLAERVDGSGRAPPQRAEAEDLAPRPKRLLQQRRSRSEDE